MRKRLCIALMGVVATLGMAGTAAAADAAKGDPYPLTTCPVSGKELGKDAVVQQIDGREIRFCCAGCPEKFAADKETYMAKVDQAIVEQQKADYPATACPVSGKEIAKGEGVDKVIGNRLVRFCCEDCPAKYEADPATYGKKLDDAIIAAQKESYPLDTCVVSGEKLGSMGDPVDVVVENKLVRLCCASCEKKLRQEPAKYLSELDKAGKTQPADKS